jgi:hypothetical protein
MKQFLHGIQSPCRQLQDVREDAADAESALPGMVAMRLPCWTEV